MLITTTSELQGQNLEYLGLVDGSVISGVNFVRDIFAGFRDFFGGRAKSYEKALEDAKIQALAEMTREARRMGADAIIGVSVDFETVGMKGSMMMVMATGTAVKYA